MAAASAIAITPAAAQVRTYVATDGRTYMTYPANYTTLRAKIGISYDLAMLVKDGLYCYRVTGVDRDSAFSALRPGDCIYSIGDSYFRAQSDLDAFVGTFPAGTRIKISYFDSASNWTTRALIGPLVYRYPAAQPNYAAANVNAAAQLNREIEAVILKDEPGWWTSYDRGSINGAHIRATSADGRTTVARAYYSYNGGTRDWVDVKVSDGKFVCMQYGSESKGCRAIYSGGSGYGGYVLGAVALGVVALLMSGGSGGGSSDGYASGNAGGDDSRYRPRPGYTPPPEPRDPPRTYGHYGDCPAPGAGYGC